MSEVESHILLPIALLNFFIFISGRLVCGDSLETDKQLLLNLKSFFEDQNPVERGFKYTQWNPTDLSPCKWPGISCNTSINRVTGIDLSDNNLSGKLFDNFSAITELTYLDLSKNTFSESIRPDLSRCQNLKFLNLSHNIIVGELNLTGLNKLEVLDLTMNRIYWLTVPEICDNLVVANISNNNFTGGIGRVFERCMNLKYLDLSYNYLTGNLSFGLDMLNVFSVSHNNFSGPLPSWIFTQNCSLQVLDLSENLFFGELPTTISNCKGLVELNLWGNYFSGSIPREIGTVLSLKELCLGSNNFSSDIPDTLSGLSKLIFLDLSRNNFGGEMQEIFGQMTQVRFLMLHGNSYIGGIVSSGIPNLVNLSRLDLSNNHFAGPLPVEISHMKGMEFLILANNQFSDNIPSEYGELLALQALDLSSNRLTGSIPPSMGKLKSLLWLMFANNSLSGEIPPELGNCSSLLWLNLANNQLTGPIPPQLANIGSDPMPTFLLNREKEKIAAGSGDCFAMKRWIPADYPPFSFIYPLLIGKNCRILGDRLFIGDRLMPVCEPGSNVRTNQVPGYIQLSDNKLSGEIPPEIGLMQNMSMLHMGANQFSGRLPSEIGQLHLVVLNISQNNFSGEIPKQIGHIKCLQNLDLSFNNFSGPFPTSLSNLHDLNKFNISYNPYLYGVVPEIGQLVTFEKSSFLGDPLLRLPSFMHNSTNNTKRNTNENHKKHTKVGALVVIVALVLAFLVFGVMSLLVCLLIKAPMGSSVNLLEDTEGRHDSPSSTGASSSRLCATSSRGSDDVKVIRLDRTSFTHSDILKATWNFSNDRIIGRGGFGIVYRGDLPDGREVAVKKLQREGIEGEREFRAEMEALSGNGSGWPHPNLVTLYGWCLDGSEKLLVYEYMEGGTLDDVITDRTRFTWKRRIQAAIDVARALVYLHHDCYPCIVHRDVKGSNVLLDRDGRAKVTDFGLARVMISEHTHVSTMVAGTIGYVAPEYGQTMKATTKGDVYSYGVLAMELATGRHAIDGGEECLVEWATRVMGDGRKGFTRAIIPVALLVSGLAEGAEEMCELLRIGIRCTAETPNDRPNMKQVLDMLISIPTSQRGSSRSNHSFGSSRSSSPLL
ncbi:probable LRR receptor-like serine/threonine-protein kinase At1g74360 [Lycium ferocissimum]|uniref:probable LRR receptor-like serine/threonine-protein kinase At1g74360 n=1 Tax=Lycium ferocissimum TaxID=112874 RepID=UPI0028159550|nr:probable LRR receptor-like serine/threonine-protein kinase At1g74360 [Lycium ferocissimum]